MNPTQLNGLLRHAATALGGFGIAASQDELQQFLSALLALLGVIWSIYEKRRPAAPDASAPRQLVLPFVLPLLVGATLLLGCKSVTIDQVITPARVKAVVQWGAYSAAQARLPGARFELERARGALADIQAAEVYDVATVAAAMQNAGCAWLGTQEGNLAIGLVMAFEDLWYHQTVTIASGPYAKAVVDGALAGLDLALHPSRSATLSRAVMDRALKTAAIAAR